MNQINYSKPLDHHSARDEFEYRQDIDHRHNQDSLGPYYQQLTEVKSNPSRSLLAQGVSPFSSSLEKHRAVLTAKWPGLDLQKLFLILDHYAQQVPADKRSSMVDNLVGAILAQVSTDGTPQYDKNAILVFALVWVIVTNIGEAHRARLALKQGELLPGIGVDKWVSTTLERLGSGKIRIAVLLKQSSSIPTEAQYDASTNTMQLKPNYFKDPLFKANNAYPLIIMAIPHELLHAHQDFTVKSIPPAQNTFGKIEADAYIFGAQCYKMLNGPSAYYQTYLPSLSDQYKQQVNTTIQQLNALHDPKTLPFALMLQESIAAIGTPYNKHVFDAVEKAPNGVVDTKIRAQLAEAYAQDITWKTAMRLFEKEYKEWTNFLRTQLAPLEQQKGVAAGLYDELPKFPKTVAEAMPVLKATPYLWDKGPRSALETYLQELIRKLYVAQFAYGDDTMQQQFYEEFIPALKNVIAPLYQQLAMNYDGK